MPVVSDKEKIARLFFYPYMGEGKMLKPEAFPMDELLAKKDKNGSSVDRYDLLKEPENLLYKKAKKMPIQMLGEILLDSALHMQEMLDALQLIQVPTKH